MSTKAEPVPGRRAKRFAPAGGGRARQDLLAAAAFLGPFIILALIFQYGPLLLMVKDSFYDYTLITPDLKTFVGFDNFVRIFTDQGTVKSLIITLLLSVGVVILTIPLAFLLAMFLNGKLPARGFVRTMVFLPVITSSVVVATLWTFLLNANGLINSALGSVGISQQPFLTSGTQALPAIIVLTVWQQLGMATVLYLGGLQSLPSELMEAATIDGASPRQRFRYITIPLMSRTTVLVVVVITVFALQSFAPAYIMTGGAPNGTTNTLVYLIYQTAFTLQQPGYASAISLLLLVIALAISLVQMRLLRTRWDY
ncbi:carbohydrate ABC transporter permease [Pedococcus sp. 5OH_020]|uniref:carbohydrate ABC transporter permease n=1 Tax=Pedococcus sp. 5OH_020 TaxID=2989814 RepID=UPI0022E9C1A5|nr:sugar ABC transporter permease [Pedococcus sp. 5OH_020]